MYLGCFEDCRNKCEPLIWKSPWCPNISSSSTNSILINQLSWNYLPSSIFIFRPSTLIIISLNTSRFPISQLFTPFHIVVPHPWITTSSYFHCFSRNLHATLRHSKLSQLFSLSHPIPVVIGITPPPQHAIRKISGTILYIMYFCFNNLPSFPSFQHSFHTHFFFSSQFHPSYMSFTLSSYSVVLSILSCSCSLIGYRVCIFVHLCASLQIAALRWLRWIHSLVCWNTFVPLYRTWYNIVHCVVDSRNALLSPLTHSVDDSCQNTPPSCHVPYDMYDKNPRNLTIRRYYNLDFFWICNFCLSKICSSVEWF